MNPKKLLLTLSLAAALAAMIYVKAMILAPRVTAPAEVAAPAAAAPAPAAAAPAAPAAVAPAPAAVAPAPAAVAPEPVPAPVSARAPEAPGAREDLTRIEAEGEQARVAEGLEYLETVRRIPGAAPLVDEIVEFMKADGGKLLSTENLPRDENGLTVLDGDSLKQMIRDDGIRAKWEELMAKIAADGRGRALSEPPGS